MVGNRFAKESRDKVIVIAVLIQYNFLLLTTFFEWRNRRVIEEYFQHVDKNR